MFTIDVLRRFLPAASILLLIYLICYPIIYYFVDPYDLRRFPAPSFAGFSNIWSAIQARRLRRSRSIFEAHRRLGPIVRVQPTHVSFADPRAIADIYGHSTVLEKDIFYETLSSDEYESIVGTRSREEHARKRRYISNVFSQRNVVSMEPLVADKVQKLVNRLDRACEHNEIIDIRQWLNLFTFDVISDMAFGKSLDFLLQGDDLAEAESADGKRYRVHAISAFQLNTVHVAMLGHFPALLPVTRFLTQWFPNNKRGTDFTDMCVRMIRERLSREKSDPEMPDREDFFRHLLADRDGVPRKLPQEELVQEAGVMMSAGSDTTASAMTNTLYLLMKNSGPMAKLRAEVDDALSPKTDDDLSHKELSAVAPYRRVQELKYLRAALDEGLRDMPPTSLGLLRQTPPEGAVVAGHPLKGGITASAATYTIHHDPKLFPDPFAYRPERWLDGSEEERRNLKSYVIPFTLGRHACLGRNIAFIEQYTVISTLVHRFEFEFAQDGFELAVLERINANPGEMPVRVRRRKVD